MNKAIFVGIVSEFKKFNANLKNPNWSVSSINSNNELIVSLWGHKPLLSKHPTEKNRSIVIVLIDGLAMDVMSLRKILTLL